MSAFYLLEDTGISYEYAVNYGITKDDGAGPPELYMIDITSNSPCPAIRRRADKYMKDHYSKHEGDILLHCSDNYPGEMQ